MSYETGFRIGAGGMGEVFKAWNPELERWVALKYLRHDDPVMVERLLREARAQARVDHPSVCKVYEVGEEAGRPFIAMEYIEGKLLHEAAETMSLEQKVLLICQVAEAVQAAHAVGLIHRDLKPANIMIAEGPEGGSKPYVLDFGIAREHEVAGLTVSGQVLGTPGYLSPEQALGRSSTLDRRTDIFSLGVILYELLSGEKPFAGNSSVEILVNLLEEEAAPLSRIMEHAPRDLETIVMRCLEKDPSRRYLSARALAEDLDRFLDGEPVLARPVGQVERLLRKARKYPLTTAAMAVAGVAVLALAVVATGGWVKYTVDLRKERNTALKANAQTEAREKEAAEISDFLVGVFSISDPDQSHGEMVTARELLDRGAERIEKELQDRPRTQARLLGIMGEVYGRLGLYDQALPLLQHSLKQTLSLPKRDIRDELEARVRLADLCANRGDLEGAAEILTPVEGLVSATPKLDPGVGAQALGAVARLHLHQGQVLEAGRTIQKALTLAQRELGHEAPLVGDLLSDQAEIFCRQKQWDHAIALAQEALEIRKKAYGPDDPRVATTLNNLSLALRGAGRLKEAAKVGEHVLELREKLLGPEHPRVATALNNLGLVYKKLGQLDRAEELYEQSLALRRKIFGEESSKVATAYLNLGGIYLQRGDLDRTESLYRKALAINEKVLGPDHPTTGLCLAGLVLIARKRGDFAGAEHLALRDLRIREKAFGVDSPNIVGVLRNIGAFQLAQGRVDEARANLTRSRDIAVKTYGEDSKQVRRIDEVFSGLEKKTGDGEGSASPPEHSTKIF